MKYFIDDKEVDYYGEFLPALNSSNYRIKESGEDFLRLTYGNPEYAIEVLKERLAETDYQALKYVEGALSEEEYAPMKAQRQAWRDEINRLEKEILNF